MSAVPQKPEGDRSVPELEPGAAPRHMPHHQLVELFDELSFRERLQRVLRGLSAPRHSGDYKYARLQMLRLSAPVSAAIVPLVVVSLLALFAGMRPPPPRVVEVQIMQPEPVQKLDEVDDLMDEPIEPPEPIELDFTPDVMMPDSPEAMTPAPTTEFSPQPAEFDSVAIVKSPVILKGIYGSRSPGARGGALASYGGSGVTEGAVIRALRWLKREQHENGSWAHGSPAAAMTGLGLLTFLAHGETPASEEFGPTVETAIRFLVADQAGDGRFKSRDGHDYTLPIAAYAICEAFALTKVPMLKDAAQKAIQIVIRGQHDSGGWDYGCKQSKRDDTSYMGWCAQALKAAYMSGLEPDGLTAAMRKAIAGFKQNAHPSGGFGYTGPGQGGLTGVGVLCMQLLGAAKEPEARNGLAYLEEATFSWSEPWGRRPIYYWYYITQAKFHAGDETWRSWNRQFSRELVGRQVVLQGAGDDGRDIGYWEPPTDTEKGHGLVYSTTLCTLILEVYYRYLPTFKTPRAIEVQEELAVEDAVDVEITI